MKKPSLKAFIFIVSFWATTAQSATAQPSDVAEDSATEAVQQPVAATTTSTKVNPVNLTAEESSKEVSPKVADTLMNGLSPKLPNYVKSEIKFFSTSDKFDRTRREALIAQDIEVNGIRVVSFVSDSSADQSFDQFLLTLRFYSAEEKAINPQTSNKLEFTFDKNQLDIRDNSSFKEELKTKLAAKSKQMHSAFSNIEPQYFDYFSRVAVSIALISHASLVIEEKWKVDATQMNALFAPTDLSAHGLSWLYSE